jgi:hypothetical protein
MLHRSVMLHIQLGLDSRPVKNLPFCCKPYADFSAGITRERLEGFDRKITEEPQDFPDKRNALIADFQNYLGIIKAVHEGADLQVERCGALHAGRGAAARG